MGIQSSKRIFQGYDQFDELHDPIYGNYTVFKNPNKPHDDIVKKDYVSTIFTEFPDNKELLFYRAGALPNQISRAEITKLQQIEKGFCSHPVISLTSIFHTGSVSLESLLFNKGAIFPEESCFDLLFFIARTGIELQRSLNWFPKLQLGHIFVGAHEPIITNPFLSDAYISSSLKVGIC